MVIVCDDLMSAIKKAGLTGFNYMKAKEFVIIPMDKEMCINEWRQEGRNKWEIEHILAESGLLEFEPE